MNDQGGSMGRDDISATLQDRFGEFILAIQSESDRRIYIDIAPQSVERATRLMLEVTGEDLPPLIVPENPEVTVPMK